MASEKITAIIEELKTLTVLELSDLVHAVEDEFGVSAAAAVAVAAPGAGEAAAEEKTEFDVVLKSAGSSKINRHAGERRIIEFARAEPPLHLVRLPVGLLAGNRGVATIPFIARVDFRIQRVERIAHAELARLDAPG